MQKNILNLQIIEGEKDTLVKKIEHIRKLIDEKILNMEFSKEDLQVFRMKINCYLEKIMNLKKNFTLKK